MQAMDGSASIFDGTLAHWDGIDRGNHHIGDPIEPMVEQVRKWLDEGRDVRIFTARTPHPAIRRFCFENFGQVLPITNTKDHMMQAIYDDRAVGVVRNHGRPFAHENVKQVFHREEDEDEEFEIPEHEAEEGE